VRGGRPDRLPRRRGHAQPARAPADDLFAVGLRQPAPHPVGLVHRQSVPTALLQHRARPADLLRPCLAVGPGRPPLALRVEEEATVHPATGAVHLPVPDVRHRNRKPPDVRHPTHPAQPSRSAPADRCGYVHGRTAPNLVQVNRGSNFARFLVRQVPTRVADTRTIPRWWTAAKSVGPVPHPPRRATVRRRSRHGPGPASRTGTCSAQGRCRKVIRRHEQRGWPAQTIMWIADG
jgi:hypothetical protein